MKNMDDINTTTTKLLTIHVKLPTDEKQQLKDFSDNRGIYMTDTVRYALQQLYVDEDMDPTKDRALRQAIGEVFTLPAGLKFRTFWIILWLLADNYPDASSKRFWKEPTYRHMEELSNKEVHARIGERYRKIYWELKNKNGD